MNENIAHPEEDHARDQALLQLENIVRLTQALQAAPDDETRGQIEQEMNEDPLSVEVRSDWHSPGANDDKSMEYRILLCTGGPACQIRGDLNGYNEPENALIEYQDWGTPWAELFGLSGEERDALLSYARHFYFGE